MRRYLYLYFALVAAGSRGIRPDHASRSVGMPASRQQQAPAQPQLRRRKESDQQCRRRSIPRSQLRAATLVAARHRLKRWFMRLTLAM